MKYDYKYLVGDVGEKANELWVEHPDVMEACCNEAVRAWRMGYRRGYVRGLVPTFVIGSVLTGAVCYGIYKIKERNETKKTKVEFVKF